MRSYGDTASVSSHGDSPAGRQPGADHDFPACLDEPVVPVDPYLEPGLDAAGWQALARARATWLLEWCRGWPARRRP